MSILTIPNLAKQSKIKKRSQQSIFNKISSAYHEYVEKQNPLKIFWYMKTIISIPCVYMVISIMAMAQLVTHIEYYAGFTMALFFFKRHSSYRKFEK